MLNVYYLYARTQGQSFYSVEFCVIIVKYVVIYNNYSYFGGTSKFPGNPTFGVKFSSHYFSFCMGHLVFLTRYLIAT